MAGRKVLGCLFFLGFDFFFLFAFSFLVVLAKMKTVFFVAFVVVLFFCADSASCQTNHTFPSYGNYFSYYYSWMQFFLGEAFGFSGDGVGYYDFTVQRQKFQSTFAAFPLEVSVFQYYDNHTQYTVLGDLKGNVLNCTAERLLGDMEDPDFMGSSCHYKGQEIVENRKCTGWYCDPFVYGTTIVDAFIYTENNRVEAPLREVISYSTNEEVLLGSMLMDIASFWKTKPSSRVWTLPSECYGLDPTMVATAMKPFQLPQQIISQTI